jgi:hypothetical protein
MLLSQVQKLFNDALAGETLSYKEMLPHLDAAIDEINTRLNTIYPVFSEVPYDTSESEYNFFPDKYIRMAVIPGAAWHFYVMDEEGLQTAPQYQANFENGKFIMQRDMLYKIPEEYQDDDNNGFIVGDPESDIFGDRGLVVDIDV